METATITIAGKAFNISDRYEEGHELTAGEASALNQTLRENVRNNLAKKADLTQEGVDEYAGSYIFGVRTASGVGRTADPVMAEFMRLARDKIKTALKAANKKADSEAINAAAKGMVNSPHGAPLMELAKKRVAEAQSIASAELGDIIAGIPEKQPEAPVANEPQAV